MFLVDKYRPKSIKKAFFHRDILEQLTTISQDISIPHMIFYGPLGSGKNTLINLFLAKIFGQGVNRIHDKIYNVTGSGNSVTEVIIKQSKYHIVIEPNNNNFDRYLIHDVVKKYAKCTPVTGLTNHKPFKIVFINNLDDLSYYAQTSLRRTMELYSKNCRFIMLSRCLSKVIDPLISRCLCFRVQSPPNSDLFRYSLEISARENISLNMEQYNDIISKSQGNIKTLLWSLEMYKYGLENSSTTYVVSLNEIIELITKYNPMAILEIRQHLYNMMITNISSSTIIKDITNKLLDVNIDVLKKNKILEQTAIYDCNLTRGRRNIMHLEAFIQNVIYILHLNK